MPIHQTTSYVFKSTEHAANLFALKEMGWIYTRLMNPTTDVFEQRMAALDGGIGALALSSGQQAIAVALFNLVHAGGHIVSAAALYGGTITLFGQTFKRLGIDVTFVDATDPKNIAAAIRPEHPGGVHRVAGQPEERRAGLPGDRRRGPRARPAGGLRQHGADAGAVPAVRPRHRHRRLQRHEVHRRARHEHRRGDRRQRQVRLDDASRRSGRSSPQPDASYHGTVFHEAVGQLCYIITCRTHWLRDLGGALSPFNAFLFLQGLETLHLRMPRHCENAPGRGEVSRIASAGELGELSRAAVASRLQAGAEVSAEGLRFDPGLRHQGRPRGGQEVHRVGQAGLAPGQHRRRQDAGHPSRPAPRTASRRPRNCQAAGISDDYVRVSVGLEDIDDIVADLDQALKASQA